MGLRQYNAKRDFTKTPEPSGKVASKKGHSFVVQKHAATRLHYDFRLELDGVLLSWAVTRGPSLNPADKRLAVRTEDHPLSYGDFEGTIPKDQYGGGTVMLWDTGSWEPLEDPRKGMKQGSLKFALHGQRMKGNWALVLMKGKASEKRENWLLIKENDDEAVTSEKKAIAFLKNNASSVKTGRAMEDIAKGSTVWKNGRSQETKPKKIMPKKVGFKPLQAKYKTVQLATLVTEPPIGEDWIHEIKYDGYRILCFVVNGEAKILTRNGHDWTDRFPSIVAALERLDVSSAVLDGEAVVFDDRGISHFGQLQEVLSEEKLATPIQAVFFDLLHLDGEDLSSKSLVERKEALKQIIREDDFLHYSEHFNSTDSILEQTCNMGLEGLISKKADAKYTQTRSKGWLKSKCSKRQEFVIVGFTKSKSGSRAIGALHLAYSSEEKLNYAGKVGTGFSMSFAQEMYDRLSKLEIAKPAFEGVTAIGKRGAHWVKPKLLCEVSFTEWTKDGHIRHPSFEGLRQDKKPKQVTKEKPVPTEKIVKAKESGGGLIVRNVPITHLEREIFEDVHITKGELAEYYGIVAPHILKQIKDHPLSLLRCPSGTDADCFFQRNPDSYMKKKVQSFTFVHKGKKHEYLYVDDPEGLVFLIQMGVIELHPWGSSVSRIDYPERMIFDLDPDPSVPFDVVKMAALDMRQRLAKAGFKKTLLKCTGGKGLHVIAPLDGKKKWPAVKEVAREIAETAAHEVPDAYVATMTKAKRVGKIFIDYFRNDYTATAIADYSVRAREGAPVAVPLDWDELNDLKAANQFSMKDVLKRLK